MYYDPRNYMEPGEGDMGHKEEAPAMDNMDDRRREYYERALRYAEHYASRHMMAPINRYDGYHDGRDL